MSGRTSGHFKLRAMAEKARRTENDLHHSTAAEQPCAVVSVETGEDAAPGIEQCCTVCVMALAIVAVCEA